MEKNKFSKNNLNQIKKYMNNKFDQSTNVDNLMLQTLTKKDEQEKIELKVNSYKSTIVLFTNVTTDSDIFYKSNPFKIFLNGSVLQLIIIKIKLII